MDTQTMLKRSLGRAQLVNLIAPLLLGLLVAWQYHLDIPGRNAIFFSGFLGFFWCLLVTVLAARDRCSELELALPVSGQRLWRTHVVITVGLSIIHVALFILPLALTGDAYIRGEFISLGGNVLAGLILTGSLIHRVQPGRSQVSDSGQLNGAVGAGLLVTVALVVFRMPWLTIAAVAIAGLVLLPAGRRVKEGLTMADDKAAPKGGYSSLGRWDFTGPESPTPQTPPATTMPVRAGRTSAALWSLGTANLAQFSMLFRVIGFYLLFSLGGALISGEAGLGVAINSILAALVCLRFLSPELIRSGSPYAHLPVPRRALYAGILLPAAVALLAGLLLQAGIDLVTDTSPRLVSTWNSSPNSKRKDPVDGNLHVRVPPQYYRIAWDGTPPALVGSNGETHNPLPQPILPAGKGPTLYNPYETGPGSSTVFVTEQFTRAVKDVYGLDLDEEQALVLMSQQWSGLKGVEGLKLARKSQRIAAGFILFALIWGILSAAFWLFSLVVRPARWERWTAALKAQRVQASGIVFLAIFMFVLGPTLSATYAIFFASVLVIQLSNLLPGAFISWVIALVCVAGAYLLGQELFARREVLPGGARL